MDIIVLFLFIAGFVMLVAGAEALVRGASRLAGAMGISPLVIGLTVVSFGTSSPEIAVSVQSGFAGEADIAIGNVVGSNIANILVVLGLSAVAAPLVVSRQLIRLDVPFMIGASILMFLLGLDGTLSRFDGGLLFSLFMLHTSFMVYQSRKEKKRLDDEYIKEYGDKKKQSALDWFFNPLFILAGLAMLVVGSGWLVHGSIVIAKALGVSELVIGLTIISIGTSLPEVATSVVASIRGERDIAVGNTVGSNLYNILLVLGLSGLVAPDGLRVTAAALFFDIPVMIAVALLCIPSFFKEKISRWEGLAFLALYVFYVVYLYRGAAH
ncbi:MAG: calcium/sodium antiporter [Chlorobiales bacterium]|nr:calcium/sodium antiporter [Chlorobiales bacterium]